MNSAALHVHRSILDLILRIAAVSSIGVAAAAHVPVIAPHLDEAPYMGVLFILFTAVCLALGAVIAVTDRSWAYSAAVAVCGSAVLVYAATRVVAFPQLSDDVGNWLEPLGVLSVVSEAGVVVLSLLVLARRGRTARQTSNRSV